MISFTSGPPADPIAFARLLWPHIKFYKQQEEIIYSVVHNDETFVQGGEILAELATIGFLNPKLLLDDKGDFLPLHLLPDEVARAIKKFVG